MADPIKKPRRRGPRKKPKTKLTARDLLFIDCYFACRMNATEAARQAGYSNKTALGRSFELLRDPLIAAEIDRRRVELSERAALTRDAWLEQFEQMFLTPTAAMIDRQRAGLIVGRARGWDRPQGDNDAASRLTPEALRGATTEELIDWVNRGLVNGMGAAPRHQIGAANVVDVKPLKEKQG